MKTIDSYLGKNFLGGCLPVLLLLLTLFGFLALSEELEDVGDGSYELLDALLVVAYSMPALIVDLLPVTVLLGGLIGLGAMANNLELVSLRAAAVSPLRIAVPIIRLALVLIALVMLLQNLAIPRLEYSAAQHRAKTLIAPASASLDEEPGAGADREFWTRNKGQFIRIGFIRPNRSLEDVEIYQFDAAGKLEKMLQASRAELLQENTWLLHDVLETRLEGEDSRTRSMDTLLWDALLTEEQTRTLIMPASALAPPDLWRSIQRLEDNNMNSEPQRVLFWTQLSVPVGLLGMALLSLPFLLGSTRSVPVGQRITAGALIGITYYLAQQISGHLAGILHWNVPLTVLAPGLVILVVAAVLLARAN
ncbi:MAG: LPS export ABC transporter permease LptG [Pseudomonadales bacterium]|nr:LPS export ABC transporter permease LptG [Halioglobus sp.]MCP5128085.1 LPS export ABC transporter permease LptG [Pseudomonadales bacterium]